MKHNFLLSACALFMATEGNGGNGTQQPKDGEAVPQPELTSDELTKIRGSIDEILGKLPTLTDKKEVLNATLEIYKLQGQEKAEINNLQKIANDKVIEERKNERIAMFDNAINLYEALRSLPKNAPEATVMAAKEAFTTAAELVKNELLAKFGGSTPAKGNDGQPAKKGSTAAKVRELFISTRAANPSWSRAEISKHIQGQGYARGTVDTEITTYLREIKEIA